MNRAQKAARTRRINHLTALKTMAKVTQALGSWVERHAYQEIRRLKGKKK